MRSINVSRDMQATGSAVWEVLADFPNIADWNSGVKKSYSTNEHPQGVGATRHCDLSPTGTLEETIREWEEGEKLVISIDSATRLPIREGRVTFDLSQSSESGPTKVGAHYEYDTKWGVIGKLMGGMIDRQLTKGFEGFLEDLDTAATTAE